MNMLKLMIVMSHSLSQAQIDDAKSSLGVEIVEQLVTDNARKASAIDPRSSFMEIEKLADGIVSECKNSGATHISVMGEPALVTSCALNAKSRGMIFVQSTTERVSKDIPQADGSVKKVSSFNHVQWRIWR